MRSRPSSRMEMRCGQVDEFRLVSGNFFYIFIDIHMFAFGEFIQNLVLLCTLIFYLL